MSDDELGAANEAGRREAGADAARLGAVELGDAGWHATTNRHLGLAYKLSGLDASP